MLKIHLAAPYANRHLRKTHHVVIHNILKYSRHGNRKARTMGTVIKCGKLMFNRVAVPVLASSHTAGIVVCHHSRPHNIGSGLIVIGIGNNTRGFMFHRKKQRLNQPVGNLHIRGIG